MRLRVIENGRHVDKVAFSPDGHWLASGGHARGAVGTLWHELTGGGSDGASVRIWRVADGALVTNLPHPDDVIYVAFSRDGRWLVTSGEDNRFRLWRLSWSKLGEEVRVEDDPPLLQVGDAGLERDERRLPLSISISSRSPAP